MADAGAIYRETPAWRRLRAAHRLLLPLIEPFRIIVDMTEQMHKAGATASRRGIQSVEIGIRLLAELAAGNGPSSLTALSVRSGLSPSQTHRYLQSLMAAGMAVQQPSLRYDLGPLAVRIGIAALSRLDAFSHAEARLRAFRDATGHSVAMSVWTDAGPILVRWLAGRAPVMVHLAPGSPMPLLSSATGQVCLSWLSEAELERPLREAREYGVPAPDLAELRARVRGLNYAESEVPGLSGVRAVAAPIFDLQGRLQTIAAAFAPGPTFAGQVMLIGQALRDACREATEAIGGRWPAQD